MIPSVLELGLDALTSGGFGTAVAASCALVRAPRAAASLRSCSALVSARPSSSSRALLSSSVCQLMFRQHYQHNIFHEAKSHLRKHVVSPRRATLCV